MEKSMIIEFSGVSCAGKSTAFRKIFESPMPVNLRCAEAVLLDNYRQVAKRLFFVDINRPPSFLKVLCLAWAHLKYCLQYRSFYKLCISLILRSDHKLKASNSFFFKMGKWLILKENNKSVVLMDEGIIQILFSLLISIDQNIDNPTRLIRSFIKYAPLPDEVVFSPTNPLNQITERMVKRGHHRVTVGQYSPFEVEKRAAQFTTQSIQLQRMIINELRHKVKTCSLKQMEDWAILIKRFRPTDISESSIQHNQPNLAVKMS